MAAVCHLGFGSTGNKNTVRSAKLEKQPKNQTRSGLDDALPIYGHLKFFKMAAGRHLKRNVNPSLWCWCWWWFNNCSNWCISADTLHISSWLFSLVVTRWSWSM